MSRVGCRALLLASLLTCGLPPCGSAADRIEHTGAVVRHVSGKSFDDTLFDLNFAITERNFRITGRNRIGAGLRQRGYTDFPDVEVVHFCSLELAREVLLLDPAYVAQMPCRITVHVQNGQTVVSVVHLPLDHPDERVNDFARRMNGILDDIVAFVVTREGE